MLTYLNNISFSQVCFKLSLVANISINFDTRCVAQMLPKKCTSTLTNCILYKMEL